MKVPLHATELTCFHSWIREDGIICSKIKAGAEINFEAARENALMVNSILQKQRTPFLVDSRGVKSMSREALRQLSIHSLQTYTIALGILVDSPVSKVIGNFLIGMNGTEVPVQLFGNEQEAVEWLRKFLKK